jgi:LuxR family maltose regulon positive regulatory protein
MVRNRAKIYLSYKELRDLHYSSVRPMLTPILATKLFIPTTGKNLVVRPRLLEKLDGCLQPGCRLTLISAPPGFGKTTLISAWASYLKSTGSQPSPFIAWLSLDDRDNDPVTFFAYLISTLQTA